jgi:hypothetical protein
MRLPKIVFRIKRIKARRILLDPVEQGMVYGYESPVDLGIPSESCDKDRGYRLRPFVKDAPIAKISGTTPSQRSRNLSSVKGVDQGRRRVCGRKTNVVYGQSILVIAMGQLFGTNISECLNGEGQIDYFYPRDPSFFQDLFKSGS